MSEPPRGREISATYNHGQDTVILYAHRLPHHTVAHTVHARWLRLRLIYGYVTVSLVI